MAAHRRCPHCNGFILSSALYCYYCGKPVPPVPPRDPAADASPWVAVVLTIALGPLGGGCYHHQFLKGIACTLGAMVCAAITAGGSLLITWPVAIIDAWMIAERRQRGEHVSEWQFF